MALYKGCVSSFRTLGSAATPHNLFSIENTAGSARVVSIRRLVVQMDATAVLTTVMPQVKASRPTAIPSGGTTLNKTAIDSSLSSVSNVIIRGATASDGGVATAITATAGDTIWQQYVMRIHTLVGQILAIDSPVLPTICDTYPFLLAANEALLVQIVATAGASNPATNFWFAQVWWEEN